jgi:two-component system NarL family sensor kinase
VLNNIIKHAKAGKISVLTRFMPGQLQLIIADDGQGTDLSKISEDNHSGLGIRNMHNRAKLIGAEFSMSSTLGKGTEVKIVLPNENGDERK